MENMVDFNELRVTPAIELAALLGGALSVRGIALLRVAPDAAEHF